MISGPSWPPHVNFCHQANSDDAAIMRSGDLTRLYFGGTTFGTLIEQHLKELDMAGEIEWIEPSWSIRQRRATFRSIPRVVFREAGRIMAAAVVVGAGVMVALYLSGEPYVKHVSKVLLVISALPIVIVLLAVVQVIVDRFTPPAKIAISAGKILVSGAPAFSSAADETVAILHDSDGRGWLVIQRQTVRLQFGVPTEVSAAEVEQVLRLT